MRSAQVMHLHKYQSLLIGHNIIYKEGPGNAFCWILFKQFVSSSLTWLPRPLTVLRRIEESDPCVAWLKNRSFIMARFRNSYSRRRVCASSARFAGSADI